MKGLVYCILLAVTTVCAAMTPEARRSFEAFERKAMAGDPEALYRLSALLERGFDSIPADTARSVDLLRRAAAAGYPPAQNYLGFLYQTGAIFPADADSARFWIRKAADQGDPKAANNLAYLMLDSGSAGDSLAVAYLRQAADAGLPQAIVTLADMKLAGRGLAKDTTGAIGLYENAVSRGFADAELKLLNLIGPSLQFYDSRASLREALRYWRLGAPAISVVLLENIGPDDPEAGAAYALLGHAFSRGIGVQYDHARANGYFARAALLGNPGAAFIIAETLDIFPDALANLLPPSPRDSVPCSIRDSVPHCASFPDKFPTPAEFRATAARAGITTAEAAIRSITDP